MSRDSGVVSKTQTLSEHKQKNGAITQGVPPADGSLHERSSDESTTASDVLIRSTLDKSERSIYEINGSVSKCSKSSYGVENFNSSGPQKIKISKKRLKEIKPFDDEQNPRSSSDSDGKVPSSLLGREHKSSSKSNSSGSSDVKSSGSKSGSQKETKSMSLGTGQTNMNAKPSVNVIRNTNGALGFPKGIDSMLAKKEPLRKVVEKSIPLDSEKDKQKPPSADHIIEVAADDKATFAAVKSSVKDINANAGGNENGASADPLGQLRSTPKYFVERHTPQKVKPNKEQEEKALIPEKRNLLQDLEDSIEITTVHGKFHFWCVAQYVFAYINLKKMDHSYM